MKLHRHFFSAKRRIEVDECPNCGGYWLDAGELAQIRAEKAEILSNSSPAQTTIPGDVIRYLYRLRSETHKPH
jgi:Zn-finger nucleic acid-binding protein